MDEQLILAEKYGIVFDKFERENIKLTHAITGAALSRDLFGVPDRIYSAIRWHTTGTRGHDAAGKDNLPRGLYRAHARL